MTGQALPCLVPHGSESQCPLMRRVSQEGRNHRRATELYEPSRRHYAMRQPNASAMCLYRVYHPETSEIGGVATCRWVWILESLNQIISLTLYSYLHGFLDCVLGLSYSTRLRVLSMYKTRSFVRTHVCVGGLHQSTLLYFIAYTASTYDSLWRLRSETILRWLPQAPGSKQHIKNQTPASSQRTPIGLPPAPTPMYRCIVHNTVCLLFFTDKSM
jgi:hypothetical protein